MSKQFAFKVSTEDLIRRVRFRYENPIDYVHNFVEWIYRPGAQIDIELDSEQISISSGELFPDEVFRNISNIEYLAKLIPPIPQFENVTLRSGQAQLEINQDRNVNLTESNYFPGTNVTIQRINSNVKSEDERLEKLYSDSDLSVILDGDNLDAENAHPFSSGDLCGIIFYDSLSSGGLNYFSKGRFIFSEPFAPGINLNLHSHPFKTTITNSRAVLNKDERKYLMDALPKVVLDYLASEPAKLIRGNSETSYQALLSSAVFKFGNVPKIRDFANSNYHPGEDFLRELKNNVGLEVVPHHAIKWPVLDSPNPRLFIPAAYMIGNSPTQVAALASAFLSQGDDPLRVYGRLVKKIIR